MKNSNVSSLTASHILKFWFSELDERDWFKKDPQLDRTIQDRFLPVYNQAICGELFEWRRNIEGRLAEIIVLDQFSRNIFRNSAKAFQYDGIALVLSQLASSLPETKTLPPMKRSFLYMPHMHSESLIVHEKAVMLFSEPGLENYLKFELMHKNIIERFGRYPHRNELLERVSTPEEIEFLKGPGSSF